MKGKQYLYPSLKILIKEEEYCLLLSSSCNRINAITASDHKLDRDSTANYGHLVFLWNICVGGLLLFLEIRKGFADTHVLKKIADELWCI